MILLILGYVLIILQFNFEHYKEKYLACISTYKAQCYLEFKKEERKGEAEGEFWYMWHCHNIFPLKNEDVLETMHVI